VEVTVVSFSAIEVKGLARCLMDKDVDPGKLRLHVSEIEPGTRAHPPHIHAGVEAFYVLEGNGTVEVGDQRYPLGPNEAILLNPARPHGLVNTGATSMRYIVVIAQ